MFAQITSTGQFCLSDAPSTRRSWAGAGATPPTTRSGGSAISASLAYDGGPAIETVRDARLIGLAAPDVASVRVLMSDGIASRAVKLKSAKVGSDEFRRFGYRVQEVGSEEGRRPGRGRRVRRRRRRDRAAADGHRLTSTAIARRARLAARWPTTSTITSTSTTTSTTTSTITSHDHDHDTSDEQELEREARRLLALSRIRQYGDTVLCG